MMKKTKESNRSMHRYLLLALVTGLLLLSAAQAVQINALEEQTSPNSGVAASSPQQAQPSVPASPPVMVGGC